LKGNRVLESDSEKEGTETHNKQWTDNTQSKPRVPLIHKYTGGEMEGCSDLKPPHEEGLPPLPPAGSKCKIVITDLQKANDNGIMCVLQKKSTRMKLTCPKCV